MIPPVNAWDIEAIFAAVSVCSHNRKVLEEAA